ncbi:hypothetical protein JCM3770_005949 [Rhodotorula araucariae]
MLPSLALAATLFISTACAAPAPLKASPTLVARRPRQTPTFRPSLHVLPLSALNTVWNDGTPFPSSSNKSDATLVARSMMHGGDIAARHLDSDDFLADDDSTTLRTRSFSPQHTSTLLRREAASNDEDEVVLEKRRLQIRAACLDSTATDSTISSLFYYGGANTTVYLCPGTTIDITNAVFFTAENQVLTTYGNPTGDTRATLVVQGSTQSCAIYGVQAPLDNVVLRNIQINGNRPALGRIADGIALIEMGGNTKGQRISSVHAYEPRGWSALHTMEGTNLDCAGMVITGNQIGPSGNPPSASDQFPDPNMWADGISHACGHSQVTNNVITDATDGGIVIFGAPGSTISGNTIKAVSRQLMGGINMVDWNPFSGSFDGINVDGNTISAATEFIKVGIAVGGMVWGGDNRTEARTHGGRVTNNVLSAGPTEAGGYFGYGIAVAGHEGVHVLGNTAASGAWGGANTQYCFPDQYPLPAPTAWVIDPYTTPGTTGHQDNLFAGLPIVFAICAGPGPIRYRGP